MPLPPGLDLLVKTILPKALGPPLLVYGILRFIHYLTYGTDWSSDGQSSFWSLIATISISLFIHPAIWLLSDLYNQFRRKRDAASRGAILPPLIRESSFQIIKAQRDSSLKGYIGRSSVSVSVIPSALYCIYMLEGFVLIINFIFLTGDAAHEWTKQYGNTYRFQIFGSSRVRRPLLRPRFSPILSRLTLRSCLRQSQSTSRFINIIYQSLRVYSFIISF
jgi:hypothetical protein